jgi:hypothetical protein
MNAVAHYLVYSKNTGFIVAKFTTEAGAIEYCANNAGTRWTYHRTDKAVPYGC